MSRWYEIRNSAAAESAEIFIYDEIGGFGVGAQAFIADLKPLAGRHLHVRINSPGGDVVEGNTIFNALTRHKGGVTIHIDGLAASMASVIAMAGAPVIMADNALLMIHNPWTVGSGDSKDLRKAADVLEKIQENIVSSYEKKTGLERAEIQRMMDEETWLNATQAVEAGFADLVEEGLPAAASITRDQLQERFDKFASAKMNAIAESSVDFLAEIKALKETTAASDLELNARAEKISALEAQNTALTADLAEARALIADRSEAHVSMLADLAAAKEKLAALESLQAVQGIVTAELPPTAAEDGAAALSPEEAILAEWQRAVAANDRAARSAIFAAHKDLLFAAQKKLSGNSR